MTPFAWMEDALCAQVDPELFFPDMHTPYSRNIPPSGRRRETVAKSVCRSCEVQPTCLQYALDNPSLVGVWGGMTESERGRVRQRARRVSPDSAA